MSQPLIPAQPAAVGFLTGFDDYMEKKEPGWKARRAGEKAATAKARAAYRQGLIARYGSEAEGLRPQPREQALLDALKPFEITTLRTYANGTFPDTTLIGWTSCRWRSRRRRTPSSTRARCGSRTRMVMCCGGCNDRRSLR